MKRLFSFLMAVVMTMAMSLTAFAAGWQKNDTGWWYGTNADNTTWYANEWQWIDGNGDGIAECYCFDANGYMYENTTTPDGYTVNADGAWTENGVVQTKAVNNANNSSTNAAESDFTGNLSVEHSGNKWTYDICWRYDSLMDEGGFWTFYKNEKAYMDSLKQNGLTAGTTYPNSVNTVPEEGTWKIDLSRADTTSGEGNIRFKLEDGTYASEGWHRLRKPSNDGYRDYFFGPNGYLVRNAKILSDERTVYVQVNSDGTWIDGNYEYLNN